MPRRTSYFKHGSFHHGENFLENISDREYDGFVKKFVNKFWGSVSNEQWQINNSLTEEDGGEIKAMYVDENGREVHFITLEDRSVTIIATKRDLENGIIEDLKRRIEESKRARTSTRRRLASQLVFGA